MTRAIASGPAIVAGHAFGHFVAKMTAVDFPQLVRGVVLVGAAQKTPNPDVQKAVAVATDPSQPEAERIKHLRFVFFAPGNDPRVWLTGFHANELVEEFGAKRVSVVVIPRAAHAIMVEQPREVADAIIAWVRRL